MPWSDFLFRSRSRRSTSPARPAPEAPLTLERLEERTLMDASASLSAGLLSIIGGPGNDRLTLCKDPATDQILLLDGGRETFRVASGAVGQISINVDGGFNVVRVSQDIFQPTVIQGGSGTNIFYGGGGPTALIGGMGANNKLAAGLGDTTLIGGPGGANQLLGGPGTNTFSPGSRAGNLLYNVKDQDTATPNPGDTVVTDPGPFVSTDSQFLTAADVGQLLSRAAAASASNDAIIAILDRGGNLLGVRVESGVSPTIQNDPQLLSYAVDGAISKAMTGAFFGNNQAPLTSRTINDISQSTITQREVDAIPSITDPNSTLRGPGFVAPVGINGHFPPGVKFTPQVDLFEIEHTNRDGIIAPGPDGIIGTADDIRLRNRFNLDPAFVPAGKALTPIESYGFLRFGFTNAVPRGVSTLPGGIPIFKNGQVVGGIGVFFPGKTGFATEENSSLSTTYNPNLPDRSLEAEYIAFAALGGSSTAGASIGTLGGVPPVPGLDLPFGRIDLVGITLDIFGPRGNKGLSVLLGVGKFVGTGNANDGVDIPINQAGTLLRAGVPAPNGYLELPHDGVETGVHLTAADVQKIVNQGLAQASLTRAAIRTPFGTRARFVYAIADTQGNIIGLFRQPDATIFSIDVAVAKARNVAYYANPAQLQTIDQLPGIPKGVAFESRTFRFLGEPRYPEGIDGQPPGPFSQLNTGGADLTTGTQVGARLPAAAYDPTVVGHDAFHPMTNFHDPLNLQNQNGIVFFPGGVPLYKPDAAGNPVLVGGLGVSGDGVDQDDVVTFAAAQGFLPPGSYNVDNFLFRNVRLPFFEFNRNPEG